MKGIDVVDFRALLRAGRDVLESVQSVQSVQSVPNYELTYGLDVTHRYQVLNMRKLSVRTKPPVMGRQLQRPLGIVNSYQLGTL